MWTRLTAADERESPASRELRRIGTKCRSTGAWTFPMCDSSGGIIGIRLRTTTGFKFSVAGSRQSLFMPPAIATSFIRKRLTKFFWNALVGALR